MGSIGEDLGGTLGRAWPAVAVAAAAIVLLTSAPLAVGQVQESLAGLIVDIDTPYDDFAYGRALLPFLAAFILAATLLQGAARLLELDIRAEALRGLTRTHAMVLGFVWMAPFIAVSVVFIAANGESSVAVTGDTQSADARGWFATPLGLMGVLGLLAPAVAYRVWRSPVMKGLRGRLSNTGVLRIAEAALIACFIALTIYFLVMPFGAIEVASALGPISLLFLSLAAIAAITALLVRLGRRARRPYLVAVLMLPMVWGAAGMDDNNFIRPLETNASEPARPLRAAMDAFVASTGEGPIVLVSTEGGGIRAAHFTAVTLSRIADQCPYLARRMFAISGVSGGSVGAAAYRASLEAMPLEGDTCAWDSSAPSGPRERRMTRIFRGDHLSPSLSKLAFPELIQRFLPATWYGGREAIVPQTDRQRGLEASFEQRFARAFDIGVGAPNPMERSAFSPAGGAPYLILNLTRVDTGADYVVSPLDLREVADVTPYFRVFHGEDDYRLSTMAATSARFPIISPVGIVFSPLDDCPDDMCRFVDGGYFDNSGIEALASVVRTMRTWDGAGARPPRRIVVLHIDSNPLLNAREEAWRPDLDVHELEAVLTAREQRVQMAYLLLNRMTSNNEICGWTQLALRRDTRVPLRLGWILSPSAADEIDRQAAALLPTRLGGEYNVTSYCRS